MKKTLTALAAALTVVCFTVSVAYANGNGNNGNNNGNKSNSSSSNSSSRSAAVAGAAAGAAAVIVDGRVNNSQHSTSYNFQGGDVSVDNRNDSDIPVASAIGGDVGDVGGGYYSCLAPVSGGVQTLPVGISLGASQRDKDCVIFHLTRFARSPELKKALMCQIPEYSRAAAAVGEPCDRRLGSSSPGGQLAGYSASSEPVFVAPVYGMSGRPD